MRANKTGERKQDERIEQRKTKEKEWEGRREKEEIGKWSGEDWVGRVVPLPLAFSGLS